jgi:hypothetical protein|tara:strand:- start:346 stop:672 length:327 start_codon:yes stop_codon:yes gene_type:complete
MLVSEEKIETIIHYLSASDDDFGKLAAAVKGLEKDEKIVMARGMLEARRFQKTLGDAENEVRRSKDYLEWRSKYENAVADYEVIKAHRSTAVVMWETWRTEQANLRRS